jgi:acetolactate synthase-1/2/3 large subunit
LSALNLPIKLIVLNNGGYLSIRNTANKFFGGHIKGTDVNNGLFFPDLAQLAEAYDLGYHLIEKEEDFKALYYFLGTDMPIIIEVICQPDQEILPCAAFGKGLDDMNY